MLQTILVLKCDYVLQQVQTLSFSPITRRKTEWAKFLRILISRFKVHFVCFYSKESPFEMEMHQLALCYWPFSWSWCVIQVFWGGNALRFETETALLCSFHKSSSKNGRKTSKLLMHRLSAWLWRRFFAILLDFSEQISIRS